MTPDQITRLQAAGYRVHTAAAEAGDSKPVRELHGRWWWTLHRPGWSGVETDPEDWPTEEHAWGAAAIHHVSEQLDE